MPSRSTGKYHFVHFTNSDGRPPTGKYHFIHFTDSDGRRPTDAVARKRLHRHVMLNHLVRPRLLTEEDSEDHEENAKNLKEVLRDQLSNAEVLAASNLPAPHELNVALEDIGTSSLAKIDDVWNWQFLSDIKAIPRTGWVAEARDTWGVRCWDAALADPLIFFTYLQIVLHKIATVTGVSEDRTISVLASKALPMLNERLREPDKLTSYEAWCVAGFVYLAIRSQDFDLAKLHLKGMQLILDLHEADRSSWPYIHLVDFRLAGLLNCRPILRKAFNFALWPPQASLTKTQAAIIERRADSYMDKFGGGFLPFQGTIRACLIQLLSCEMIQRSKVFSVVSQTECLYSLSYDICSLHGTITEQLYHTRGPSTPLVELLVIAIKLCAWSMCRYGVPQAGEVPETLLQRVAELLSTLAADETDFIAVLDAHSMDTRQVLWILFVPFVEAYRYYSTVQCILRPLMRALAARLSYKQPARMAASLQRMPCIELLYAKQSAFACRQILSSEGSQWHPFEDWSFMRKKSPLAGFITALQFDVGEGDLQ